MQRGRQPPRFARQRPPTVDGAFRFLGRKGFCLSDEGVERGPRFLECGAERETFPAGLRGRCESRRELLDFPLFRIYGTQFPAYRAFMLLISALMFGAIWLGLTRTRIGLVIQAALTHPDMASALGHNVPRIFTLVFAAGTALAGLAGVIGGNYQVTEPAMAFTMGPIVFVVVVFGGLGSLSGCFIASILMGLIQTFAVVFDVSLADLLAKFGLVVTSQTPFAELLTVTLPRVGALLPFLMMVLILVFRPRGLMGTRDT